MVDKKATTKRSPFEGFKKMAGSEDIENIPADEEPILTSEDSADEQKIKNPYENIKYTSVLVNENRSTVNTLSYPIAVNRKQFPYILLVGDGNVICELDTQVRIEVYGTHHNEIEIPFQLHLLNNIWFKRQEFNVYDENRQLIKWVPITSGTDIINNPFGFKYLVFCVCEFKHPSVVSDHFIEGSVNLYLNPLM